MPARHGKSHGTAAVGGSRPGPIVAVGGHGKSRGAQEERPNRCNLENRGIVLPTLYGNSLVGIAVLARPSGGWTTLSTRPVAISEPGSIVGGSASLFFVSFLLFVVQARRGTATNEPNCLVPLQVIKDRNSRSCESVSYVDRRIGAVGARASQFPDLYCCEQYLVRLCPSRGQRTAGPGLRHFVQVSDEKMGVARPNRVFQLLSSS